MTPQQRRALLEGLVAKIDRLMPALESVRMDAAGIDVILAYEETLLDVKDAATGALLGDLKDDEAWVRLLEMVAREVADDGN